MASLTQCTWIWVNSRSWWWTGRPGVMLSMGLQRVGHGWATELNWTELTWFLFFVLHVLISICSLSSFFSRYVHVPLDTWTLCRRAIMVVFLNVFNYQFHLFCHFCLFLLPNFSPANGLHSSSSSSMASSSGPWKRRGTLYQKHLRRAWNKILKQGLFDSGGEGG